MTAGTIRLARYAVTALWRSYTKEAELLEFLRESLSYDVCMRTFSARLVFAVITIRE